jgi:hypothetical protein
MNCSLDGLLMVVCFHPRQRAEVLLKPHQRQSSKTRRDWKPESSEHEWWEIQCAGTAAYPLPHEQRRLAPVTIWLACSLRAVAGCHNQVCA